MLTDRPVEPRPTDESPTSDGRRPRRPWWPVRLHRWTPWWLKALGALVGLAVLVVGFSFGRALTTSDNLTVGERAAEWLRDNHLGGILNQVENWWFTTNAPKEGGDPGRAIEAEPPPVTEASGPSVPHLPAPTAVQVPDGVQPVPNEGRWAPAGPLVGGAQAMYTTQVRPDSVHTSLLAGLAWMDPQLLRFELHPGTTEPGGNWPEPSRVPSEEQLHLVAAFNSAFRMQDARGGFYLDGTTRGTLRDGAASFVIYKDGSATVGMWGRDVTMTPDVVAVRQNLDLIVDNGGGAPNPAGTPAAAASPGSPAPGLDDNANGAWGSTLGNKVLVWRSGVCVTATGALVYGYGDGLGARSLSELMLRAGCVRAMELDINKSWTTFDVYAPSSPGDAGSVHGTKLLPEQQKGADRYLTTDARDFIAVLSRDLAAPGAAAAPPTTASPRPTPPTTARARSSPTTTRPSPRSRG